MTKKSTNRISDSPKCTNLNTLSTTLVSSDGCVTRCCLRITNLDSFLFRNLASYTLIPINCVVAVLFFSLSLTVSSPLNRHIHHLHHPRHQLLHDYENMTRSSLLTAASAATMRDLMRCNLHSCDNNQQSLRSPFPGRPIVLHFAIRWSWPFVFR